MKVIKTGFIGAGFVGPVHMENVRRLGFVEVNAVAEKNQKTAEEAAERLGILKAYGDWEDLVADQDCFGRQVDALIVPPDQTLLRQVS